MDYEDFDDDTALDTEAEEWDEETLGLEWDESETLTVARHLGIKSEI